MNPLAIKEIIKSNQSKMMSLTFIKADGQPRTIQFNPKTAKGVLGESASEQGKKANASFKANNPDTIKVLDNQLLLKGTEEAKCWRSVKLEAVTKVKAGGKVYV